VKEMTHYKVKNSLTYFKQIFLKTRTLLYIFRLPRYKKNMRELVDHIHQLVFKNKWVNSKIFNCI